MKIEITKELERANVTPDIAAQIVTAYVPGASRIALLESEYNDVTKEAGNGITDELAAIAKTLLKKYAKERALLEKERKGLKSPYLNATKGIDGVARYIKKKCEEHEDALKQIVHHAEIVEQQRRAKLAEERIAKMAPYKANAHTLNLELMDDDAFEMMLAGAKALHAQRKAEAEAAHAADEAARKAKREAEIADAAARLVAERDAATAAAASAIEQASVFCEEFAGNVIRIIPWGETFGTGSADSFCIYKGEARSAHLRLASPQFKTIKIIVGTVHSTPCQIFDCIMKYTSGLGDEMSADSDLHAVTALQSLRELIDAKTRKPANTKTHTVHEESGAFPETTPTLTDAELREIADNMQREITPDAGAVMLVSDAMKLIHEAYNVGFDDGSDACAGTPRYRTNEDIEAMKGERIIAHMNTIEHPAIVGYMQSENGSPTPNDVIIPKKEK